MEDSTTLLDIIDKIDSANDTYALLHIIILFAPLVLTFMVFVGIIKCLRGGKGKTSEENSEKELSSKKQHIKKDSKLDIQEFSPSLSTKKNKKKKKKKSSPSNTSPTTPKISKDYILSTISSIEDELDKYNMETPGYPYYPPEKYWKQNYEAKSQPPKQEEWLKMVKSVFVETNKTKGIILKVHLPYSETLCHLDTYNKAFINENHERVEAQYVKGLLNEWSIYRKSFGIVAQPKIKAIHLIDGVPCYFSPENLKKIVEGLVLGCDLISKNDSIVECHPGVTTEEHLKMLFSLGFNRLKIRVYDFAPNIVLAINLPGHTFNNIQELVNTARKIGFKYIQFDCVYGLPKQTLDTISSTLTSLMELEPDHVTLNKYQYVEWNNHQRNFSEATIPDESDVRVLHLLSIQILNRSGYTCLGLDNYVRLAGNNPLLEAMKKGNLQYSSVGFIINKTNEKDTSERYKENKRLIIGLGVSAISDTYYAYAKNSRSIRDWLSNVLEKGKFSFVNGHELSQNEELLRGAIWQFVREGRLKITKLLIRALSFESFKEIKEAISEGILGLDGFQIKKDGLMVLDGDQIWLLNKEMVLENDYGRKTDLILPGICQIFDNCQYRKKKRN